MPELQRWSNRLKNSAAAILKAGLTRLQKKNSGISIRSLASRLELSSSYLSKVFRGERSLPETLQNSSQAAIGTENMPLQ